MNNVDTNTTTNYHEIPQHINGEANPEWLEMRKGKLTGSKILSIVQPTNGLLKANKQTVMKAVYTVVAELETGFSQEGDYKSPAMEHGTETESEANREFKKARGLEAWYNSIGFIEREDLPYIGLSPDDIRSDRIEGLEIKCPTSTTHVMIHHTNKIPNEWLPQLITYFVMEQKMMKMNFVSYDFRCKRFPLITIILERADYTNYINSLEESLFEFCRLVDETI